MGTEPPAPALRPPHQGPPSHRTQGGRGQGTEFCSLCRPRFTAWLHGSLAPPYPLCGCRQLDSPRLLHTQSQGQVGSRDREEQRQQKQGEGTWGLAPGLPLTPVTCGRPARCSGHGFLICGVRRCPKLAAFQAAFYSSTPTPYPPPHSLQPVEERTLPKEGREGGGNAQVLKSPYQPG